MSEKEKPLKKIGLGKKALLLVGAILLMGGGGAAVYASKLGFFGAGESTPDLPQLVLREGVPASVAQLYFSPTGDKRPDPAKFQPTYYPLDENFTANLRDADGFVQVALGVSTYYDQRVLDNVKLHEMAVRSAILMTLSEHDSAAIASPQGKEALKGALRTAINDVLKKKEGFGGIDDVLFTSFVIQ